MQTNPTPFAEINALLEMLLSEIQAILGKKLIGLYLFGSLVAGDFNYDSSDIDVVAAMTADLNEKEFELLSQMHADIARKYKRWDDRLEIGYIAVEHLKKATPGHSIALISPGEPFHVKEAETDWIIINRYILREKGLALSGSSPKTLVDPIAKEEIMHATQKLIKEWREWITHTEIIRQRKYQAFMILTMCRMLYTVKNGAFVSKKQAALWAEKEAPEWSSLIQQALLWRAAWRDEHVDHDATLPETLRFVHFVLDQCENDPR